MEWLTDNPGLPVWALVLLLFIGCATSGVLGYLAGCKNGMEKIADRVEVELDRILQRRAHDLADRGRTTERRPEHEGQQPAVNRRVQIVGKRPGRPDHPGDQRI